MRMLWLAAAWLSAGGVLAADYGLVPLRSVLVVKTYRDGVAARLAHNHVVAARDVSGHLRFEEGRPEACSVTVHVPVATLILDDPVLRKRFGESSALSQTDRSNMLRTMLDKDQLWADRYPTLSFVSTAVSRQPDGRYLVNGNLTMRGVTRAVTFPATVERTDGMLRARGEFTVKQSQFGWSPFSTMLGAIKVKDEVTFFLDLVAAPTSDGLRVQTTAERD